MSLTRNVLFAPEELEEELDDEVEEELLEEGDPEQRSSTASMHE